MTPQPHTVRQLMSSCCVAPHIISHPRLTGFIMLDGPSHENDALLIGHLQGDKEKALGLPASALMDRDLKGGMVRSQLGFFSIVGASTCNVEATQLAYLLVRWMCHAQLVTCGVTHFVRCALCHCLHVSHLLCSSVLPVLRMYGVTLAVAFIILLL